MANTYEDRALKDLLKWQQRINRKPSLVSYITKGIQTKTNSLIPDKVHEVITATIKNMVKAVLIGSKFTTKAPLIYAPLKQREELVKDRLQYYKKGAALSGAGTGAGGILLGLADFPILIGLKFKFLFEIASIYGYDVKDYRERLYILYVFQLAFSSQQRTREVYQEMLNWDQYVKGLPENMESFDWRTFQQEYRDYIDLAKLLQLVPGIGAAVGAVANYRLMDKLGEAATYAYRLRLFVRENRL